MDRVTQGSSTYYIMKSSLSGIFSHCQYVYRHIFHKNIERGELTGWTYLYLAQWLRWCWTSTSETRSSVLLYRLAIITAPQKEQKVFHVCKRQAMLAKWSCSWPGLHDFGVPSQHLGS